MQHNHMKMHNRRTPGALSAVTFLFAAGLLCSKLSLCLPVVFSRVDAVLQNISELNISCQTKRAIPDHGLQN